MAKKQNAAQRDFESDDAKEGEPPIVAAEAAALAEHAAGETLPFAPEVHHTLVEVPLADVPDPHYRQRHVNLQLSAAEADAMKRLLAGLDMQGERLANGRRVQTSADAVRWLLEKIHSATK